MGLTHCYKTTVFLHLYRSITYHPEEPLLFLVASGDVVFNLLCVLRKQCVSSACLKVSTRLILGMSGTDTECEEVITISLVFPFINLHIISQWPLVEFIHVPTHLTSLTRREDLCHLVINVFVTNIRGPSHDPWMDQNGSRLPLTAWIGTWNLNLNLNLEPDSFSLSIKMTNINLLACTPDRRCPRWLPRPLRRYWSCWHRGPSIIIIIIN